MTRYAKGLLAACLIGGLCVDEASAQRFGRGGGGGAGAGAGGRSRPGTSPSARPSSKPSATPQRPGNSPGVVKPSNGAFPSSKGGSPFEGKVGAGDRGAKGARPGSLNDFLGVEKGATARDGDPARERTGEHADHWAQGSLAAYGHGTQPFTAEWYKDHPNAFQAQYPHADAYAAASRNNLGAFLAVPVGATGVYATTTTSGGETVVAAEPTTEEVGELAAQGDQPVADDSEWMQIGVFALLQGDQTDAARMIQLAVNKDGVIRGSHYDLLSDETQSVQGSIDKKTQLAAWTIGKGGQVVFQSTLDGLTQEKSKATAYFPNGKSGAWQLLQTKN